MGGLSLIHIWIRKAVNGVNLMAEVVPGYTDVKEDLTFNPNGPKYQMNCLLYTSYNIFQKWYRDTRKKVVEVQVDGAPAIGHEEKSRASDRY